MNFLLNYYFNFFHIILYHSFIKCGSNFVDGVNTNLIGYIIILFISKFDYVLDITI